MNSNVNGDACRPLRVLVVDDVADAAAMLTLALRLEGFNATAVSSPASALAAASSTTFDAVILDIAMPGMHGYALANRICGLRSVRPLLIAVTGYGQEQDRERSRNEGFDHHFLKPADIAELAAVLHKCACAKAATEELLTGLPARSP